MTKELMENSYVEALLRAAAMLGDGGRSCPIHEVTVSAFEMKNEVRCVYPRCRLTVQSLPLVYNSRMHTMPNAGEDYVILYPIRRRVPS